nr:TPA_asm: RNA-dependent RNA polymerase [Allium cepa amalgavirus 2]
MASSSGPDPTQYLDITLLSDPVAESVSLQDAVQHLASIGVRVERFTRDSIHAMRMSVPAYVKEIRILGNISDRELLKNVMLQGVKNNVLSLPEDVTPQMVLSFARWLKRGAGARVLADQQHLLKINKKAVGDSTPDIVAFAHLLDQQVQDLTNAKKRVQHSSQVRIDELRKQIAIEEHNLRRELAATARQFTPANDYAPPSKAALDNECWELYCARARDAGRALPPWNAILQEQATTALSNEVINKHRQDFCKIPSNQRLLQTWAASKIQDLRTNQEFVASQSSNDSWLSQVETHLWRLPLPLRLKWANTIPVGKVVSRKRRNGNILLRNMLGADLLSNPMQRGIKNKPPLARNAEVSASVTSLLDTNARILVLRSIERSPTVGIPTARSRFEGAVRKVIGGGEMIDWRTVSNQYRGGGCFSDAILLLADARTDEPGKFLPDYFTLWKARDILRLPSDLKVPCNRQALKVSNFNNDATAGPFFRAYGIKSKYGMRGLLEDFAWECYSSFVDNGGDVSFLPFVASRVGFRTKLVSQEEAFIRFSKNKAIGRCVMMLDAIEQMFSSPLYNVLSKLTADLRFDPASGFRNTIVRASSDWAKMWEEVKKAHVIVELDWKKFDRERPTEDLAFMIDVIISCFKPENDRERLFLLAYKTMMQRCLIERFFVTDCGGVFKVEGMVPSGSLWTGWVDTALNILYLNAALLSLGFNMTEVFPKCAGDDNLTLFMRDVENRRLLALKDRLNSWFRAGIEAEDFLIHRPPFFVTREQAVFPRGTDLTKGTSKIIRNAVWVPIEGEMVIDQEAGRSHRWQYVFRGKPKFLSAYWLEDGRPIRPTHINSEKLLFPEGIHDSIDTYEAAVLSMVVDNPFNHHNINHCMHRFVICEQVKRQARMGLDPIDILWLSRFRSSVGEEVPYPMIASWRRQDTWVDMEQLPFVRDYVRDFREFVSGVTSLYSRQSTGGLDSWKFTSIIRGETEFGEGQFGNDIDDWISWMYRNPVTKYLRPIRRFRAVGEEVRPDRELSGSLQRCIGIYRQIRGTQENSSSENFAIFLSNVLRQTRSYRDANAHP